MFMNACDQLFLASLRLSRSAPRHRARCRDDTLHIKIPEKEKGLMIRLALLALSAPVTLTILAGCVTKAEAPIVDMEGVDIVKYNRDLADCELSTPVVSLGSHLTKCMHGKGYKILLAR
ncbi:hypothetical protein [Azospirillum lipoferum]|nr:hypothetical protein [Azospirillum lipoferum]